MQNALYDIPLNGYAVSDYVGDAPFEHRSKERAVRATVFDAFLGALPSRLAELRKIVPEDIPLDYGYRSLEAIDAWMDGIIKGYRGNHFDESVLKELDDLRRSQDRDPSKDGSMWDWDARKVCPPIFRSIATDLGIYLVECLRRTGMGVVRWIEGYRNARHVGAGHPRAYPVPYRGGLMEYYFEDGWCAGYLMLRGITSGIAYDRFGFIALQNGFKAAHGLKWDEPVPQHLLHPQS